MALPDIQVAAHLADDVGEGPIWDPRTSALHWVDITSRLVHSVSIADGRTRSYPLSEMPGSLHLTAEPRRVRVTTCTGIQSLDLHTGRCEAIGPALQLSPGLRFNEGKTDPYGRIVAGTMNLDQEAAAGTFMIFDAQGNSNPLFAPMTVPNGLDWSDDRRSLFHIDSVERSVRAFKYPSNGAPLANPEVVLDLKNERGVPDGMCMDAEGMLWIAFFGGHQVARFDLVTRACLLRLEFPVSQITSCCFGGSELRHLYVTSARFRLQPEKLAEEPLAGALFRVNVGVRGRPAFIVAN